MVLYTLDMVNSSKEGDKNGVLNKKAQMVAIPVMTLIAIGVILLAIVAIMVIPTYDARQRGTGAYGFQAYEEVGTDLGVGKVVSKKLVADKLGDKALAVGNPQVTNVFNWNGNRGQTVTYDFVRADGVAASVYIDVMVFKDSVTMDSQNILRATKRTSDINGYPAYFMHAQTLGLEREYRLMVVDGLKVYKFVMTQPNRNITISEVSALAALKQIADASSI